MADGIAIITALILDRPTCGDCIATKSGVDGSAIDALIERIEVVMAMHRSRDHCRVCGAISTVYSVEPPST
jgi:ribosomal protein S27AE